MCPPGPAVPASRKAEKAHGGEGLGTRLGQNHTLYVMGHVIKSSRLSPRSFVGEEPGYEATWTYQSSIMNLFTTI